MEGIEWLMSLKPQAEPVDMKTVDWSKFLPHKLEIPDLPSKEAWRVYKKSKKQEIRLRILKARGNR